MTGDMYAAFNQFFELIHANTDALRRQVYALRYQVYVLETAFEHDSNCECGIGDNGEEVHLEYDEFDQRSDHYLIRHRRTGVYAATVRLILPDHEDVHFPYPIETHCPGIERITDHQARSSLAEISRYAVSKEFKRRVGEMGSLAGVASNEGVYFEEEERRVLPHISLGLIATIIKMAKEHHIQHLYAVMEPALLRLLSRFGIVFDHIGPSVDYHGTRVPCRIRLEDMMRGIEQTSPPVWDLMSQLGKWDELPG